MTDLSPTAAAATAPRSATATARPEGPAREPASDQGGGAAISSDFQTFLRMLTAQMENQDPLNPLDSTDFAVQLATFSGVEQQVRTNDMLAGLKDALGATGLSQFAGWVGMEARVAAPVRFDGTPISLDVATHPDAERAELLVRDADGRIWDRQAVAPDETQVDWSGIRADGTPFGAGTYGFEVVSYDADGTRLDSSTPLAYGLVAEAREGSDGAEIVLAGGSAVPVSEVRALRAP